MLHKNHETCGCETELTDKLKQTLRREDTREEQARSDT